MTAEAWDGSDIPEGKSMVAEEINILFLSGLSGTTMSEADLGPFLQVVAERARVWPSHGSWQQLHPSNAGLRISSAL